MMMLTNCRLFKIFVFSIEDYFQNPIKAPWLLPYFIIGLIQSFHLLFQRLKLAEECFLDKLSFIICRPAYLTVGTLNQY